ncbi:MAG TPA: hypothetical protein VKA48_08585, partial [Gammaproteobacteria bacterium]|nr:hypothetical protein [Gammaproteobacteria bacterium]
GQQEALMCGYAVPPQVGDWDIAPGISARSCFRASRRLKPAPTAVSEPVRSPLVKRPVSAAI